MKNMKCKPGLWIIGFLILVVGTLSIVGINVIKVDPFFHYHKPDTDNYFYMLNNQRSQNDGISKHFDYDALITGTSMTENFKTSELDELFGTNAIKVCYSGSTYKEINDNLINALTHNDKLKMIVRGLDMGKFVDDKDLVREDLGEYPTYLYDKNIFNDVEYIFNRNVIFDRVYPMTIRNNKKNFKGGITSFDDYSNWMNRVTFGIDTVCPEGIKIKEPGKPVYLTDEERNTILGNVNQNITSLAQQYPEVDFYYFFTPYSIVWWQSIVDNGTIYKQIQAERVVIEEILKYDNIKLFSFNNLTDITTDLNNYKDTLHYGDWVNSLILQYMHDDKCLLTKENYQEYLKQEESFYTSFDYSSLINQKDYKDDNYAAEKLN